MKKVFTFIILICICFIPSVVDAKISYEVNWRKDRETLVYKKDNKYYTVENLDYIYALSKFYNYFDILYFNIYDKNGELLTKKKVFDKENDDVLAFMETEEYYYLKNYFNKYYNNIYDNKTKTLYSIGYYAGRLEYTKYENNQFMYDTIRFDDNIEETKRILGKRYDIYYDFYSGVMNILDIYELDNYYVVEFYDSNLKTYRVDILDEDYNLIIETTYVNSKERPLVFENNRFIFLLVGFDDMYVYKSDGTLYDTFKIDTSFLDDPNGTCGDYEVSNIFAKNMELTINYNFKGCPSKMILEDDFVGSMSFPKPYFLNLRLKFDIQKEENKGGSFTYEETYDDEGRGIVELRITPDKGYTVKEIIVTDINGNKIEVTDNKFYMPMSDVKVEVKYEYGEYVPIPDTFLGKSVTLIFIGLLLVSLGLYTINYVRQE